MFGRHSGADVGRKQHGQEAKPSRHPAGARRRAPRSRQSGNAAVSLACLAGAVGLGALSNHGTEYDVRQTSYLSREDCLRDWGSEESCSAGPAPGSNGLNSTYVGPRYYWDPDRGRPVIIGRDGAEHVSTTARVGPTGSSVGRTALVGSFARGGFGGIGRGFSFGRGG